MNDERAPITCARCPHVLYRKGDNAGFVPVCNLTGQDNYDEIDIRTRPEWCPLPREEISPESFKRQMEEFADDANSLLGDPQCSHMDADSLMVEVLTSLGYGEGCEIFENMHRWYA